MDDLKDFKTEFAELLENTYISSNATNEEATEFWKKINALLLPNIPTKLYRFRTCNVDNIMSFQKQNISICIAGAFKDEYDSLIYINRDAINKSIQEFIDAGGVKAICDSFDDNSVDTILGYLYSNDIIEKIKDSLPMTSKDDRLNYLLNNLNGFKEYLHNRISTYIETMRRDRFTKIACFTEDVKSLYMWDQYADGYKGYALEYDFTNYLLQGCLACPKQQGCEQENKNYSNLFPVIYSEKRYDATNNVINIILREVMENTKAKNINLPVDQLHWYKTYLYKDAHAYSHEREWRIITRCPYQPDSDYSEISNLGCLKAIYYGPKMEKRYKDFLMNIAQVMGIKQYNVVLDEYSTNYELKIIEI